MPVKPAAAVQQPEIKTADLYSLAKAMPSTVDMPNLLLELDQVARSAGVTLSTISPGAPAPSLTAGFSTLAINLSFSGDFYSLTDMLYRLRSLVTVRNGALQTSGRLFSDRDGRDRSRRLGRGVGRDRRRQRIRLRRRARSDRRRAGDAPG